MFDISAINKKKPAKTKIEQNRIRVVGLDAPGILSQIVGQICVWKIEIESAFSRNFSKDGKEYFEDVFIINENSTTDEQWSTLLPIEIDQQLQKNHNPSFSSGVEYAHEKAIEMLAQYSMTPFPVVDIQIAPQKDNKLEIAVFGESAPFFLFSLTLALAEAQLSIVEFSVNTHQGFVEDNFIVECNVSQISLATLRIKLLLYLHFAYLLHKSPNPIQANKRFQQLIGFLDNTKEDTLLASLISDKTITEKFAQILGYGDLLWEDFVRLHSLELMKSFSLPTQKKPLVSEQDFEQTLHELLIPKNTFEEKIGILNRFKDEQIYLSDIDVIVHPQEDKVRTLSEKLTNLAKVVLREATMLIVEKLTLQFGVPRTTMEKKVDWVLFGLGKFGGSALGYASDIEIMFIYEDEGKTDGDQPITNRRYFDELVKGIISAIKIRRDQTFKVDARLRPYGESGPLAVKLSNFIEYYNSDQAHSVELLALTRMRPIVGGVVLAERILSIKNNIIYHSHPIETAELFEKRKEQLKLKVKKGARNAKFGLGGLVDVEYCAQILQLKFGYTHQTLQHPSIHNALNVLKNIGELSDETTQQLSHAYMFFRNLINGLRMRRGSADDVTLPKEKSWELEHLARRIGYTGKKLSAGEQLINDFDLISAQTYKFMETFFQETTILPKQTIITNPAMLVFLQNAEDAPHLLRPFEDPRQTLIRIKNCAREGRVQELFSRLLLLGWERLLRSGEMEWILSTINRLTDKFSSRKLIWFYEKLLETPNLLYVLINVFAASKFLSEEIIKNPEYISYLITMKNPHKEQNTEEYLSLFQKKEQHIAIEYKDTYQTEKTDQNDSIDISVARKTLMRDFRKKEMLRIIVRDLSLQTPLFLVCNELSCLAQTLVQKAFFYACDDLSCSGTGIAILAFGKLGGLELNYSSDLDLLCVIDERCKYPHETQAAIIQTTSQYLNEYTSSGIAYRIDWRLRPFGNSGDIVCSEKALQEYYETQARLWEIQAAIKLRFIAGDIITGESCEKIIKKASTQQLLKQTPTDIMSEIYKLRIQSVNTHLQAKNPFLEIKNSWGGIRDIEITIQALQLIHHEKGLDQKSSLGALVALEQEKIITEEEHIQIKDNYLFLRKIEHLLQIQEDRQTHEIPKQNKTILRRLSWALLKELDEDMFLRKLKFTKRQNHEWFCKHFKVSLQDEV